MITKKILCIKDYEDVDFMTSFKKGNTYKIVYEGVHACIYDALNTPLRFNKYSFFGEDTVHEFFITHKELRKQKLEKLNGNLVNK